MAETIIVPDGWQFIRFPLRGGKHIDLWLPLPFTARDFGFLVRYLELMGEAMFGTEEERRIKQEAACAFNLQTTAPNADSLASETPNIGPSAG